MDIFPELHYTCTEDGSVIFTERQFHYPMKNHWGSWIRITIGASGNGFAMYYRGSGYAGFIAVVNYRFIVDGLTLEVSNPGRLSLSVVDISALEPVK